MASASPTTMSKLPNGIAWPPTAAIRMRCSRSPCSTSAAAPACTTAPLPPRLLASAAKLGHAAAAYDLALLYIEGQQFPQDYARAAELFRTAAQAGNPEAQYALATLYKEGRGVAKDEREAARLLGAAALADNHRRRGGIRHRAVQRHRRRQERSRRGQIFQARGTERQPDRAEPLGAHAGDRPRRRGRSGGGDQMAPRRQGGRRRRSVPRRIHGQTEPPRHALRPKSRPSRRFTTRTFRS